MTTRTRSADGGTYGRALFLLASIRCRRSLQSAWASLPASRPRYHSCSVPCSAESLADALAFPRLVTIARISNSMPSSSYPSCSTTLAPATAAADLYGPKGSLRVLWPKESEQVFKKSAISVASCFLLSRSSSRLWDCRPAKTAVPAPIKAAHKGVVTSMMAITLAQISSTPRLYLKVSDDVHE